MIQKKVGSSTFSGKEAITTYPGKEWRRNILSYCGKGKSILIITFIEKDNYEDEKDLIERL